jgi:hypothetical protein
LTFFAVAIYDRYSKIVSVEMLLKGSLQVRRNTKNAMIIIVMTMMMIIIKEYKNNNSFLL